MMIENVLIFLDGALLLLFGVQLSAALAGIRLTKRNVMTLLGFCTFCGALQLGAFIFFSEDAVRKLYPLITHLPLILFLCLVYHKRTATVLISIFTAYLCCQPVKWVGILLHTLTQSAIAEYTVRILMLVATAVFVLKLFAPYLSEIFNKDTRSVCIFGIIPAVYYLFDYATVIYTNLWRSHPQLVGEFFPALLCIMFIIFCIIYYQAHEQKADAERKEHIVRIIAQQRAREVDNIRRSEKEIRMLRHDMRLFLNSLNVCIGSGEQEKAREMIASYVGIIENTKLEHFCGNETVNYVLSDFAAKCAAKQVDFSHTIELKELQLDEVLFSSILSNALDNALNAQNQLPAKQRRVKLMLKNASGKILISVRNPTANKPVFADGLPVSTREGHGFGTQSIHYMTERLGGNCQFAVQDQEFVVRIVI